MGRKDILTGFADDHDEEPISTIGDLPRGRKLDLFDREETYLETIGLIVDMLAGWIASRHFPISTDDKRILAMALDRACHENVNQESKRLGFLRMYLNQLNTENKQKEFFEFVLSGQLDVSMKMAIFIENDVRDFFVQTRN